MLHDQSVTFLDPWTACCECQCWLGQVAGNPIFGGQIWRQTYHGFPGNSLLVTMAWILGSQVFAGQLRNYVEDPPIFRGWHSNCCWGTTQRGGPSILLMYVPHLYGWTSHEPTCWFPKIGYPQSSSIYRWCFPNKNHPAIRLPHDYGNLHMWVAPPVGKHGLYIRPHLVGAPRFGGNHNTRKQVKYMVPQKRSSIDTFIDTALPWLSK